MPAPIWITPPGDLGTIVEQEFYQIQLNAENAQSYKFLSGKLPRGIQITPYGSCEGYPRNEDFIQGVPAEVGYDTTSKFVVRAYSSDGLVADRVFQLTVTGEDPPTIESLPAAYLGPWFDGDEIDITLTATDPDPGDTLSWRILSGNVPGGLTLTSAGRLFGYINPVPTVTGTPGFDVNAFDVGSYDFRTLSENKTYEFTVEVSDSKQVATKTYTMFVASRNTLTADTDLFTADTFAPTADSDLIDSKISSDQTNLHRPVLLTLATDLGTVKHDNFFAYQFVGRDFDGDPIEYSISVGTGAGFDSDSYGFDAEDFDRGTFQLPPGLVLDSSGGWLSGYIPQQAATTKDYQFAIRVRKTNDTEYYSEWTLFTMTIEGDIDDSIIWPNSNLGTISTGDISELNVIAQVTGGRTVRYEFKTGYKNKLPNGLRLDDQGYIVGRASFETFMLDTGTTFFDTNDLRYGETTFDKQFTFTVRAFSNDGVIDTFKTFSLKIINSSIKPYESLYARAFSTQNQRDIYETLINNADDLDPDDIYRPTDFYFGIQRDLRFLVASGLNPAPLTDYVEATARNHWNNILRFGALKTARALDSAGNVKYEIVYVELVDKGVGIDPATGNIKPASQSVNLNLQSDWSNPLRVDAHWPKASTTVNRSSNENNHLAFPNAIENMRSRMKTEIGSAILERYVLPDWMQDKQEDGTIIGWKLASPIVYCKPGTSSRIKYLLERRSSQSDIDLKLITFEVDRFIIDNNMSKHYNKLTGKYTVTYETTFDLAEINSNVSATVDYSVSTARFDSLNGVLASEIPANSITGITNIAEIPSAGVTVIWLNEDGLTGSTPNEGWNRYLDSFGEAAFDSEDWDSVEIVPGFREKNWTGSSSVNQRMGVWRITVNSSGYVVCTFVNEIINGNQVRVTYDNITYYYEKQASTGILPRYVNTSTVDLNTEGDETYFDGRGTRFFANVDKFAALDEDDTYIKFPQRNVFR